MCFFIVHFDEICCFVFFVLKKTQISVLFINIIMYNRQKAIEYALKWWDKRNPYFYDFDELGGDCTNFVSQCLYFGGIEMNFDRYGWYYKNLNSRAPAWTGVDEFYKFSTNNKNSVGVRAKLAQIDYVDLGDIVQLKLIGEDRFHHSLIVTKIVGQKTVDNVFVTSHTYDAINKPISHYFVEDMRFLKILN